MTLASALERVQRILQAGAEIADASSSLGRRARAVLPESTGLSPAGIELALRECLERAPHAPDLERLVSDAVPAKVAHVALPANVFIAPLRAIALALAESPTVRVRPSRREPHFTALLAEAAPGLFEIVPELTPTAGDSLWAYGGDEALRSIASKLAPGVTLRAHGPGFGLAVVDVAHATPETARSLADDIAPFEQRGCLSPRLLLFHGDLTAARTFAKLVAAELTTAAQRIPPGRLDPAESAEIAKFRDTFAYAGVLEPAGAGFVSVPDEPCLEFAPPGRNLLITAVSSLDTSVRSLLPSITAVGLATAPQTDTLLTTALPQARMSRLGDMQRPPLDGPVDRRTFAV